MLECFGRDWQGLCGEAGAVTGQAELLSLTSSARALLLMSPGQALQQHLQAGVRRYAASHDVTKHLQASSFAYHKFISANASQCCIFDDSFPLHWRAQVVASLDMRNCTVALLLDHMVRPANAGVVDTLACAAADATEGAALLLLRGVRAVISATAPGTPGTHVALAGALMRSLAAGASLAEATATAPRAALPDFELRSMSDAALVMYGVGTLMASSASSAPSESRKAAPRNTQT